MKNKLMCALLALLTVPTFAQKNFWKAISINDASTITKGRDLFENSFKPLSYKLFTLDDVNMSVLLKQAITQNRFSVSESNLIIPVPLADGSIEHFRIAEAPVMQPQLQAKYPGIRTYAGEGVEHPSSTIRFDFSKYGLHAIIISPTMKTVYINAIINAKSLYVVFDRSNVSEEKQVFDCKVDKILNSQVQGVEKPFTTSDGQLRTYRLAVASGGEFSNKLLDGSETNNAQKKAKVLAALVTDIVRTNAIFETDFGVHLDLVNNEDTIIFLDGKTDPYQSGVLGFYTGRWNTQAQAAFDTYIGSANYDIGHLLMGYGTGGNAGCIGCVCKNATKGSGATGFTTNLTTDPFIVDFWDHELGHQFGANHTFDYSYEGSIAQMEPGSGSTIMGYAGTTGATDIQPHSDAYFHSVSIQQVDNYITNGDGSSCAVATATGDAVPVVNAKKDRIIPKSTPFVLSGSATDGNRKDSLTYCWEQFDVFQNDGSSNKFPNANSTTGPVFRSLDPTSSKQRMFPALPSILNGSNQNKWEVLPAVSRELNFRLTVRDNHHSGGSTSSDDMVITVDSTSGPFLVTSQDTSVTWTAGSKQKISWSVNHTNFAPVNCSHVQVLLSLDGGQTFPIVLSDKTENDGILKITVPDVSTTHARIKVTAIGNIFFDISNADFTITGSSGIATGTLNADALSVASSKFTVQPNPAKNFTTVVFNTTYNNCRLVITNSEGRQVYQKSFAQINKGGSEKIQVAGLAKGIYFLKVISDDNTQTQKLVIE